MRAASAVFVTCGPCTSVDRASSVVAYTKHNNFAETRGIMEIGRQHCTAGRRSPLASRQFKRLAQSSRTATAHGPRNFTFVNNCTGGRRLAGE